MSYDLNIYFPQKAFPYEEWHSVLSLFNTEVFNSEEREASGIDTLKPETDWVVLVESKSEQEPVWKYDANSQEVRLTTEKADWEGEGIVWVLLRKLSPGAWGSCCPVGSCWEVHLSTSGIFPKSIWTQFAIPYYALGLIKGITVHDCQWHIDESGNLYSFQDAEKWKEFASIAVECRVSRRGWPSLERQGLMTEEGNVLF